jgi:hypothetical protein
MAYKIALLKELERLGSIDEKDLPKLLSELKQRLGIDPAEDNLLHTLDVIEVRGGEITLSEDGIKYLKIIKTLHNNSLKM